jgi:hypothetical protein
MLVFFVRVGPLKYVKNTVMVTEEEWVVEL